MNEHIEKIEFQERLQEFLAENALPCPPIPLALFPFLQERGDNFFATDWYAISRPFLFMEDMAAFLEDLQNEETDIQENGYAAFGLSGYGLQSKYFNYFLYIKGLTLAVSLPWGLAYADPQAEQNELKAAYELIETSIKLASKQNEQGQNNGGQLSLLINAGSCVWKWADESTVHEGNTLLSLVEFLEQHIDTTKIPPYMWTRV